MSISAVAHPGRLQLLHGVHQCMEYTSMHGVHGIRRSIVKKSVEDLSLSTKSVYKVHTHPLAQRGHFVGFQSVPLGVLVACSTSKQ